MMLNDRISSLQQIISAMYSDLSKRQNEMSNSAVKQKPSFLPHKNSKEMTKIPCKNSDVNTQISPVIDNTKHIAVKNKFLALSVKEKVDLTSPKHESSVLFLADSHGKNMSRIFRENSKCNTTGIVKPGATTKNIIDVNLHDKMLSENDYVVCITGANDVAKNEANNYLSELQKFLRRNKQ